MYTLGPKLLNALFAYGKQQRWNDVELAEFIGEEHSQTLNNWKRRGKIPASKELTIAMRIGYPLPASVKINKVGESSPQYSPLKNGDDIGDWVAHLSGRKSQFVVFLKSTLGAIPDDVLDAMETLIMACIKNPDGMPHQEVTRRTKGKAKA